MLTPEMQERIAAMRAHIQALADAALYQPRWWLPDYCVELQQELQRTFLPQIPPQVDNRDARQNPGQGRLRREIAFLRHRLTEMEGRIAAAGMPQLGKAKKPQPLERRRGAVWTTPQSDDKGVTTS